jgi:hypothetical protein
MIAAKRTPSTMFRSDPNAAAFASLHDVWDGLIPSFDRIDGAYRI